MGYGKDNRLSHVNEQPVEMDADGNLLVWTENEQTHTYAYDARNRLVRTGQAHYTYDAEFVRTSMTWKGKTTRYVVDQPCSHGARGRWQSESLLCVWVGPDRSRGCARELPVVSYGYAWQYHDAE
ncbi:hypothetical protein [Brevibacillus laterosporus]|uniref:RHS repeat protein n=1 Tax=Brevibacillus laterosporus TaxID=1465 RepID=A0A0F7BYL4_BRELA|nr:hypothetical protein EX87_00625 [Brevibacillus laterosporus]